MADESGIPVTIQEDYTRLVVLVQVGEQRMVLSVRQARELAAGLQRAAGNVKRKAMERGVFSSQGRKGKGK